jgi:hypothetical protein
MLPFVTVTTKPAKQTNVKNSLRRAERTVLKDFPRITLTPQDLTDSSW